MVYLDSVVSKVLAGHPNAGQHAALLAQHKAGGVTPLAQVEGGMQALIRDLVLQLDRQERDPDGVILVFLPTYRWAAHGVITVLYLTHKHMCVLVYK